MKFSILTVVRNRVSTIGHALSSIAAQTHDNFEHVVQDGGSTDGTLDCLRARAGGDDRIKLLSEEDSGIYDALNRALARASGDVIGVLHSDDFYAHVDVLSHVARRFAETGADAVYGDLDYVSTADQTRVVRHWRSGEYDPRKLRHGWMPPHPALFIRHSVMRRWGAYNTNYRIAADYDLILRYLGQAQITPAYLPEVLIKMRLGGASNRSLRQLGLKSAEDYRALKQNSVGGLATLILKNLAKIPQFISRS